ncbi:MAG: dipicolinic acid synthetase, partial [Oscillospiraceae bacterium]|nr:dipicolinic acid synthetase [Oscillospiraceae bacterium]
MSKAFAVLGTDARTLAAGEWLKKQGFAVLGTDQLYRADFLLLPLPLDKERAGLAQLLRAARPGAVALAGRVPPEAKKEAEEAGVPLLDYFEREDLALLNAVPTAEGCIRLLMENRTRTLWGSRVLILGYGRIGSVLARRLKGLEARPTAAMRSAAQQARALSDGCEAIRLEDLEDRISGFDTVVNTIPAPVLGRELLEKLPPESLL